MWTSRRWRWIDNPIILTLYKRTSLATNVPFNCNYYTFYTGYSRIDTATLWMSLKKMIIQLLKLASLTHLKDTQVQEMHLRIDFFLWAVAISRRCRLELSRIKLPFYCRWLQKMVMRWHKIDTIGGSFHVTRPGCSYKMENMFSRPRLYFKINQKNAYLWSSRVIKSLIGCAKSPRAGHTTQWPQMTL